MMIRLRAAAASDEGPYRTTNQDAAFTAPWAAGVADGVGGGPSGDLASAALVHRFAAGLGQPTDTTGLESRIRMANWDLRAHVERDPSLAGMATTFTGLFVSGRGDEVLLAHTGDSRAYLLHGPAFTRETRDDSYVQALVDHGLLSSAEALQHPHRNLITSSLAGRPDDGITVGTRPATPGDRWLLCSDGLSDYLPEAELARALGSTRTPDLVVARIVEMAIANGSKDNVTAVVCDIHAGSPDRTERATFFGSAATLFGEQLGSSSDAVA